MRKATLVSQPVATVYVQLFKDVILEVIQSTGYPQKFVTGPAKIDHLNTKIVDF